MRIIWIKIHLYLAAFFAPMILLMATSGGLYLLGIKGETNVTAVQLSEPVVLNPASTSLEQDVRQLLAENGIEHEFEYVKVKGDTMFTRPTSRSHYEFRVSSTGMKTSLVEVDLQKTMVELHKGHGPLWFKDLQKVMALGLLVVLITGVWLGLLSPALRLPTLVASTSGIVVFVLAAFLI